MAGESLQSFFSTADKVTLNNCDLEEIHRSGAVQHCAIFLAFDRNSKQLVYWSENASEAGLVQPSEGQECRSIGELLPDFEQELLSLIDDPAAYKQHVAVSEVIAFGGQFYDAVVYTASDLTFVELLPSTDITPYELKAKLRTANKATGAITKAMSFEAAEQFAVDVIRQLTGFDRVKIYRFLPDGSGCVTAEARDESMPSYLGLHFPETDIPKQARHLYTFLPFRVTFSTEDDISPVVGANGMAGADLDLTWSLSRSVSTMHTAYLRNMGIESAFSAGLIDRGELWGLIACHGKTQIAMAFDVWGLVRDIADALMLKLSQEREAATTAKIREMRDLEANVAVHLREKRDIEDVLVNYSYTLQQFLDADGFAFQFDGKIYSIGETPPKPFIRKLIKWVGERPDTADYFRSKALHLDWAPAKEHMETACGVLIQPVIIHRVCQLVWFRGPVTKTVRWAGDPNAKSIEQREDGTHVLHPRNSFDQWVTEHREESRDWTDAEISAAREIFKEVLDIIASQAQNLKRMAEELTLSQAETREELAQFAYAAAHDIQNPINTITRALEMLQPAQEGEVDPMVQKTMDFAVQSSQRLRRLADQMANFVALGRREIEPEPVPLDEVVADALQMLDQAIQDSGATFDCAPLPVVAGSRDLLTILLLNLFSNAMKYRAPDRAPVVKVRGSNRGRFTHFTIEDNGIGVSAEDVARIFQPFNRLHRADDVSGSGLGLATCKRIAELHKAAITIDPDYTEGARFMIDFHTEPWARTTLS